MDGLTSKRTACTGCEGTEPLAQAFVEEGISRRAFLVHSGILTAVAALSACGLSSSDGTTAPNVNSSVTVSNYPALANVGGVAVLTLGNAPLAIVRTGTSSFLAFSRVCPHQGGIVQLSGNDFVCPVHGATFNLSGQWIGGQRTSSLRQYTTSYDSATGVLTISS